MRDVLDAVYKGCAYLAAVFMVLLLGSICLGIAGGLFDFYVRGTDAISGYFMAAAIFLSLPYTLRQGDHIRVTLILHRLTGGTRRAMELFALVGAIVLSGFFAWYSIRAVYFSYLLGDISQSDDRTPLWIPQIAMAVGVTLLFVAFVEQLVDELRGQARPLESADAEATHFE